MLADVEDGDEDVSKEKRQESVRLSYSPRFSIMKSNSKTELSIFLFLVAQIFQYFKIKWMKMKKKSYSCKKR